jgi:polyhydroxybutyrate depolymerase
MHVFGYDLEQVASTERSVPMRKRIVLLTLAAAVIMVLVLVWILVLDKPDTAPRSSRGCGTAPLAVPGETGVLSMLVDGLEREYRLHLPTDYDQDTATSLVLAFHWYGGNAQNMESATWTSHHADKHGYITVYPESTSFHNKFGTHTSWNDLSCSASSGPEGPTCSGSLGWPYPPECGEAGDCVWCTCHDDLAYVHKLLGELEDTLCIDLDRVYATGISNGAMFVHRLGCDMADRFAAIAPVAGTLAKGFNCAPGTSTPLSIMHIYGSVDKNVPVDGSESDDGYFYVPLDDVMDAWASAASQGCDDIETPYPTSGDGKMQWECAQRADCATGSEVVSCSFMGGHRASLDIFEPFGNNVIWEFFSKNSKQR